LSPSEMRARFFECEPARAHFLFSVHSHTQQYGNSCTANQSAVNSSVCISLCSDWSNGQSRDSTRRNFSFIPCSPTSVFVWTANCSRDILWFCSNGKKTFCRCR
jgi:hypothetical protein